MASLTATSVVSAAIISGDLIIGLSDGSVINCGRCQGPQGLDGPTGAMGSTGRPGQDGNTILTSEGTPRPDLGVVGDYVIDKTKWNIYGPKSSGGWGSPTPLRGNGKGTATRRDLAEGVPTTGEGSKGGDAHPPIFSPDAPTIYPGGVPLRSGDFWVDNNGALHIYYSKRWNKLRVYSDTVIAAGDAPAGSVRTKDGGTSSAIAEAANGETFANQFEYNNWLYYRVDRPPVLSDGEPAEHPDFPVTGLKPGDFWINSEDQLFTWKANQWVQIQGSTGRPPIFSNTPPTEHPDFTAPDNALVAGDTWFDNTDADQLKQYVYDGTQWVAVGNYVKKKGGDTMEGQLIINGPRKAGDDVDNPKLVSSLKVLSIDNAQNSSLQLRHSGNAKVYVGDTDISIASDIKFNRAAGSVVRSNVQDILNIGESEIAYLGRSIEDEDLITKKYVDDTKEFLQQEIIELEEEIDAIAPSTERGTWSYNPVGNVAAPGAYTMYTDTRDEGLGGVASIFAAVKNITLNERDLNNTVHSFGGTEPGDLLEVFEEGDSDYGLYSIISIEKLSNPNPGGISYTYISIDVDLERTGNGDKAETRARFKVFKAPSGGDASGFVMKTGDKMTGDLTIDTSEKSDNNEAGLILKGNRGNTTNSAATIAFDNEQSTAKGYLTYRSYGAGSWFAFNRDVDLNNNGLHSVARIRMEPNGGIGSGNNTRLTFHNASTGQEGEGLLVVPRPSNDRRSFAIRGNDSSGNEQDMLYTYTNPTGTPDAANYVGKIDSPKNLVNKEYVDSKFQSSSSSNLPVMLHSGYGEKYSYENIGSLSSNQITSDSLSATTNTIYLYRAYDHRGGSAMVVFHDVTPNSEIELWEHKDGPAGPELIIRAGIRQISTSLHSSSDAKLTLNKFWSKPDYNFSKYKYYTFILRGLVAI